MRTIVYIKTTGEIVGVVEGSRAAGMIVPEGLAAKDSPIGDIGTHRVDLTTLAVIEYSPAGKAAYAARPGPGFSWDPIAEAWIDDRTLEAAKADAWAKIKARREVSFAARAVSSIGIAYAITKDKTNLGDRIKSLEAAIAIGAASSATIAHWRDLDNAEHPLTIAGYYLLAAEMGARGQAIFEHSWALDAQVQGATTKAAIAAINTEAGWP